MEIANSMMENIPHPQGEFCQTLGPQPIALRYQCAESSGITL
jgi:hypothetical protein